MAELPTPEVARALADIEAVTAGAEPAVIDCLTAIADLIRQTGDPASVFDSVLNAFAREEIRVLAAAHRVRLHWTTTEPVTSGYRADTFVVWQADGTGLAAIPRGTSGRARKRSAWPPTSRRPSRPATSRTSRAGTRASPGRRSDSPLGAGAGPTPPPRRPPPPGGGGGRGPPRRVVGCLVVDLDGQRARYECGRPDCPKPIEGPITAARHGIDEVRAFIAGVKSVHLAAFHKETQP